MISSRPSHPAHDCDSGSEEGHSQGRAGRDAPLTDGDDNRCLHAGDSRERAGDGQLHQPGAEEVVGKESPKTVKPLPDVVTLGGKVLKRGAVSVKVFGNLTPNDTKREKEGASKLLIYWWT